MYYYQQLDKNDIEKLADEAGKTAHLVRNYCQGYDNLSFPEVQTLDNQCGNIEAQCRQIKGNLLINNDIKPNVINCARITVFLIKILSESFFSSPDFPKKKLAVCRQYVNNLKDFFEEMDNDINKSILRVSTDIFKQIEDINATETSVEPKKTGSFSTVVNTDYIEKEFNFDHFDQKRINADKVYDEFKAIIGELGSFSANNSHATQDIVADLILSPPYDEQAKQIINRCGQIENNGRAMIDESETPKMNIGKINKNCENILAEIKLITNLINSKEFLLHDKVDDLLSKLKVLFNIMDCVKKTIQKGYKK